MFYCFKSLQGVGAGIKVIEPALECGQGYTDIEDGNNDRDEITEFATKNQKNDDYETSQNHRTSISGRLLGAVSVKSG